MQRLDRSTPRATGVRRRALAGLAIVLASCFDWTRDPAGRPEYLVDYIDTHYRDLGQRLIQPLSRAEFRSRLAQVRLLFLGDHHRDSGLHHEILALLDWITDQGFRPLLGLESIGIQDAPALKNYLAGRIKLRQLRQQVRRRWPASWLDSLEVDHTFYRHLLRTARADAIPVFALEPTPRHHLLERDALIAASIRRALRLHPDRLIVVIVGHAHLLGDGHLIGRIGAPSLAIVPQLPDELGQQAERHPRIPPTSFLQTERGILFFASARQKLEPPPR